jgi:hypothetical protein
MVSPVLREEYRLSFVQAGERGIVSHAPREDVSFLLYHASLAVVSYAEEGIKRGV